MLVCSMDVKRWRPIDLSMFDVLVSTSWQIKFSVGVKITALVP